jgi:cGMP-dependent protein kinase
MKNLELEQIDKIIGCLFPVEFPKDSLIIKEGEIGNTLYITGGYFIL